MAFGFNKQVGGEQVRFGFYWNLAEWEAQIVAREGGVLKGDASARYLRLPLAALLVLAPLMGAAYAFFLPFIGFAMLVMYLAGRLKADATVTNPPAAEAAADAHAAPGHGGGAAGDHQRAA